MLTYVYTSVADIHLSSSRCLLFFFNFLYCTHPQCGVLDIPHILTHLEVEEKLETSINVYPSQKVLNSAFFDIMKFLNWTKCAIIYDQNNGKLMDLFLFHVTSILITN